MAVVWAISYFYSYLNGHSVTEFTDHAAVKAVLEMPNPSKAYLVVDKGVQERCEGGKDPILARQSKYQC